jgi:hypothetical protein
MHPSTPTTRGKIANLVNTGSNFRCDKVLAIFPQAERPTSKEFAPKKEICFSLKGLSHEMDFKNFDQNLKNLV